MYPDPGSGAFLTPGPGSGIREGEKIRIRDPDHISESLKKNFDLKILKFFDADPGSGVLLDPGSGMENFGFWIRKKHP
jgi:hypothetical protein